MVDTGERVVLEPPFPVDLRLTLGALPLRPAGPDLSHRRRTW